MNVATQAKPATALKKQEMIESINITEAANIAMNQLVKTDPHMQELCLMVSSGLFPNIESLRKGYIISKFGQTMGLDIINSLKYIYIQPIKRKGEIVGNTVKILMPGLAGIIDNHPHYKAHIVERTNQKCRLVMFYQGKRIGEEASYTIEEAKEKGLLGKDNWIANQEAMLHWRCLYRLVQATAPGLLMFGANTGLTPGQIQVVETPEDESDDPTETIIAKGDQAIGEL